jgi:hypothetical protein
MKFLYIITILVFSLNNVQAQSRGGLTSQNYQSIALTEANMIATKYSLTNIQRDSVFAINKARYSAIIKLNSKQEGAKDLDRKEELAAIEAKWEKGLQQILSNKQYKEYSNEATERVAKMKQKSDSIKAVKKSHGG